MGRGGPARRRSGVGRPAGSAVPLVWAHAEYLKLLRSAVDGKVFDRIDRVYERYCEPEGRKQLRSNLEIYSRRRPIQRIKAGQTLRILDESHFEVVWSADGWKTTQIADAADPPGQCGIQRGSLPPARNAESGGLLWTLHWPEQGSLAWIQCGESSD